METTGWETYDQPFNTFQGDPHTTTRLLRRIDQLK